MADLDKRTRGIILDSGSPFPTLLWTTALSGVIGLGVGQLMAVTRGDAVASPAEYAASALIGVCINLCCMLSDLALSSLPSSARAVRLVRVFAFLVGGMAGFVLGSEAAHAIGWTDVAPSEQMGWAPVLFFGLFAVVIGATIETVLTLRYRLAESVARIKEQEFAQKELETARSLQRRLLPPEEIEGPGWRVAAKNLPAQVVAGDFYDVFVVDDGALVLVVADVAGKGMPAALIMASVKAMLPYVAARRSVEDSLDELNERLLRDLAPREFVALAMARFEPSTGRLTLGNAGLPNPYVLRGDGSVEELTTPGPRLPLGMRSGMRYETLELDLKPGDRLISPTDGLPEASSTGGEPLGYERFQELFPANESEPMTWLDRLVGNIETQIGTVREDDWTILMLEARSASKPPLAIPING